jgi:geranylgeranyl pyrophosphate synthase
MNDEHHKSLGTTFTDYFPLPADTEPHLRAALDRVLNNPGSLVRPQIVAKMFAAYGLPAVHATELGLALEYFHTASLLFDDLPCMDDAQHRRGAPCIHAEFGEAEAILAALALVNRAYGLTWKSVFGCGQGRQARALEYIERYLGVGGLLNGQSMDINYAAAHPAISLHTATSLHTAGSPRTNHTVTEAIAMGKTVSLIRLTLVLPGILGDASPAELQLLDRVAICWGLTYQIVDDLKDLLQSPEESGKTVARDISMGRPNIALAIGIPGAVHRLQRLINIGDRMLDRLVALRPGVTFLQELRVQLDAEATEIIDNACESNAPASHPISLQGAA